jgi:hypothetical protein
MQVSMCWRSAAAAAGPQAAAAAGIPSITASSPQGRLFLFCFFFLPFFFFVLGTIH